MKYFTKEWYNLMQRLDYVVGMEPIADKTYSDEEISALYDKKLKTEIARDRREYDTPPQFVPIDFDDCDFTEFCTYDAETGTLKRPASMEEVKRGYEEEKARADEEFKNRPPFDPKETIAMFETAYESGLKYGYSRFPDWVKDQVDIRLIALGYLPKSVFGKLKAEQKRNNAEFDKINRKAAKALVKVVKKSAKIPERLSKFGFHDGRVLSLEKIGADWVLTIEEDCVPFEGETPYTRVVFKNGEIIEQDENLTFKASATEAEENGESHCYWLYDELYKTERGYEAHMLFDCAGLCYLTISCDDILIEKNITT